MRIVIALGGNALLRRSDPMTTEVQRRNIMVAAQAIAPLVTEHSVVIVHGNGPQVGLLSLQAEAYSGAEPYPLDVLDAGTQGMIGYLIQQELRSLLPPENQVATLLTMIVVDPDDPAFASPTKFVGPVYTKEVTDKLAAEKGWAFRQDGAAWRRVVPSPEPQRILEIEPITWLLERGAVVICAGGGGIPTMYPMYLALGIATVIYIAIALGVFGTLTVEKVISSGGTALAVAAEPSLGQAGYWLMSVTALFATAGATNAGLYPAPGLSERLVETRQFPPLMARKFGGRLSAGLLFQAVACLILAVLFKLDAIASIGSAVALVIFTLITAAHFRVRSETGANPLILALAIGAAAVVLVTFVFTTLIHEPASIVTLLAVLVLSIGLDFGWKRVRDNRASGGTTSDVQVGN